jgi:hypothetical protein
MKNYFIISIIFLAPILLSGCGSTTIKPNTPSEYTETKEIIESYYGSTQKEIIREFGAPDWKEKKNDSTYYIYQWKGA